MKKNYFVFLITMFLTSLTWGQSVIITAVIDGKAPSDGCSGSSGSSNPKAVELYVDGTVDFTNYTYEVESNGPSSGNLSWSSEDISSLGVRTNEFVYISPGSTQTLFEMYSGATSSNTFDGGSSFNGNDAIRITDGTNILDQFGDPNDVTGSSDHDNPWAYQDSFATRKSGTTANGGTFNVTDWNILGDNYFDSNSITSCSAMLAVVQFGTFTLTASNNPSITITSPANNATIGATTSVSVSLNIQNFTVSGDAGGGVSDNSGDGYLKATLEETGQQTQVTNFFSATPDPITTVPGRTYTATVELVDNSGDSLSPKVEASVTFTVELPCDIQLGTITEVCDAATSGTDTYTTTIPFTVGNTTTYTITAKDGSNNDVGTIEGDNPSTDQSGNIVISGVPEGTSFTVKVIGGSGSSCDLSRNITSPTCVSLPIYEPFDYPANTDLIAQPNWQNASSSSDEVKVVESDGGGFLILGPYYTQNEMPAFVGNMVSFDGIGSDPYIGFSDVTTGMIYASFTFHVKDMTGFDNTNGGYFAVLTEDGSFESRLWIRDPDAGTQDAGFVYNLGLSGGSGSTTTMHNGFTANKAEPVFVVMGYDLDNDETKMWVVPDAATLGANTPPAANVTLTGASASKINRFLIRQDSSSETPSIDFDELRIGTSWKDVTSNPTASTRNTGIEGFALYPNPVRGGKLNIRSNSTDKKQVSIFNVLGKNVLNTTVTGTNSEVNVSTISSGVYILKVVEGTKTATSKLVIR